MIRHLFLTCLFFCAYPLQAAIEWHVYFNADSGASPPTGCQVTLGGGGGTVDAIDVILVTTVDTNTVTNVARQVCDDPATNGFGPLQQVSPGGWPLGLGLGLDNSDVIESFIALSEIQGNEAQDAQLYFTISDTLSAVADALPTDNGAAGQPMLLHIPAAAAIPVRIPALGLREAIALGIALALAGLIVLRRRPDSLVVFVLAIGLLGSGKRNPSLPLRSHPRITSRYCAAMSFVFKARRRAHSWAYVTVAATLKTDDRASKIGK